MELYLDVIDSMLWILAERASLPTPPGRLTRYSEEHASASQQLELMLSRAGSAWRVATDGRSRQRRVSRTAVEAFMAAAPPESAAAHHLGAAWQAAYGRSPNASVAYREAVRAVEAVAAPTVEPNNAKATLGTVLRTLRDQSAHWELAILGSDRAPRDIAPLLAMLESLWQGHSDRHAPITPIPTEAAPMAVHLAITLVQWFESGSVRRRTTGP